MKRYIFSALIIIIGLLLFFAPFGFARVCPVKADGSFMKCHWMGEAVRMFGTLIAISGIAFFICKKSRFGLAVYNIGSGVCLILLETFVIGTCKYAAMPCNVYTKPAIILLAAALMTVCAVYIFFARKETVK